MPRTIAVLLTSNVRLVDAPGNVLVPAPLRPTVTSEQSPGYFRPVGRHYRRA